MPAYKFILAISIYLVWLPLFSAKYAEYNENYFLAGFAFFISIAATIIVGLYLYYKKEIVRSTMNLTISFIATSSPLSLVLFIYSYNDIFGQFFNHPG